MGLLTLLALASEPSAQGANPFVALRNVGHEQVVRTNRATIDSVPIDLFGEVRAPRDARVVALWRREGDQRWRVSDSTRVLAGGVFRIPSVAFDGPTQYELVVAVFSPEATPAPPQAPGDAPQRALAASESVFVRVTSELPMARDPALQRRLDPHLRILEVAGQTMGGRDVGPVPIAGDVIVEARGLDAGASLHLAVHVPGTDRCYIRGPGRPHEIAGRFLFHSVPLAIPGDPQHVNVEVIAFASREEILPDAVSWEAFRHWSIFTSSTVRLSLEERPPRGDPERVAFVGVSRLGANAVDESQPRRLLRARQGDAVELTQYERFPDGARIWLLVRPEGGHRWLVQGPALPRGSLATGLDAVEPVTWVWPDLRFARAAGEADVETFELIAVVSTSALPNAWVDTTFLASQPLETVSRSVAFRGEGPLGPDEVALSIERVSGQAVEAEEELSVDAHGTVHLLLERELPPGFHVYVGRHRVGAAGWSFEKAVVAGTDATVLDMPLADSSEIPGPPYQLVALVTRGLLHARDLPYDDLVAHSVALSPTVLMRRSDPEGWPWFGAVAWAQGGRESDPPSSSPDREAPSANAAKGGIALGLGWPIIFLTILLVLLGWLEWRSGGASRLAGRAAAVAERVCHGARTAFDVDGPAGKMSFSGLALGLALLAVMLVVIRRHYVSLYAAVVNEVTDLTRRESQGLAIWIILVTVVLGIAIDLALVLERRARERSEVEAGFFSWVRRACVVAAFGLWMFQGAMYYGMFAETSVGLVPLLGGVAAFLISFAETITFFFITRLILEPLGWLLFQVLLAPLYIGALLLRAVETLLESLPHAPFVASPIGGARGGAE